MCCLDCLFVIDIFAYMRLYSDCTNGAVAGQPTGGFPHGATVWVIHKLLFLCNLYVSKRIHNIGKDHYVGQGIAQNL